MRLSAATARQIEPEILDRLPANDPRALQSRRDLQKINFFMGHAPLLADAIRRTSRGNAVNSVTELGAGDGTLMLRIARRLGPQSSPIYATAVDREPSLSRKTAAALRDLNWHVTSIRTDVFEWLDRSHQTDCSFTFANLFLHHFTNDDLRRLFLAVASRTRWFAACEPLRSRSAMTGVALLPAIGCNDVTLHDGRISVNAGFSACELTALWPVSSPWQFTERRAGLFSHYFEARSGQER